MHYTVCSKGQVPFCSTGSLGGFKKEPGPAQWFSEYPLATQALYLELDLEPKGIGKRTISTKLPSGIHMLTIAHGLACTRSHSQTHLCTCVYTHNHESIHTNKKLHNTKKKAIAHQERS